MLANSEDPDQASALFACPKHRMLCLYGLTSLQQFFFHITMVSGCNKELNAHFYSAASLKYHTPDT